MVCSPCWGPEPRTVKGAVPGWLEASAMAGTWVTRVAISTVKGRGRECDCVCVCAGARGCILWGNECEQQTAAATPQHGEARQSTTS